MRKEATGDTPTHENDVLERRARRNWILLVGICVASTLGLATAVLPLVQQHLDNLWPWAHTQTVLLSGFILAVLAAVLYLSDQQRRAAAVHRELVLAREKATERMRRHNARLEALLNVSRIMGSETSLQAVFDSIAETCLGAFDCERVSLMLLDKTAQELEVRSARGHRNVDEVVGSRCRVGQGTAGRVAETGEALVLGPGVSPQGPALESENLQVGSAMVVPILVRGELTGVLNVASDARAIRYDDEDLQALKVFAENVGTCIRHAEQAEWMRQMIRRRDAEEQSHRAVPSSPGVSQGR
jgi:transcriptional regulator with GAF, ATPase, and Fis domain